MLALLFVSLFVLLVGLSTPDRSSSSSTRVVQDVWDVFRDELGVVPEGVVLALRGAVSLGFLLMILGLSGVKMLRRVYLRLMLLLEVPLWLGPTVAGSAAFLGRGLLRIRDRRLGRRDVGSR